MNRREFLKAGPAVRFAPAAMAQGGGSRLKAGFAERDITPELGMEQPGGYGKVFHKSFHDACKVRAAVFDDGNSRVALVGVDALMVPRRLVLEVRDAVHTRCGIAPEAVLIGASHSHSSGPTGMVQPGQYDHASPLVRRLAYEKSSCADAGYLDRVRFEIVTAVCHADNFRAQARCSFGVGIEGAASFNRRTRMKNGLTYTNSNPGNPDVLGYAGPIDPQVGVIGVWSKEGKLMGCIVNYACHATTQPGGISANWIYYMEKTIRGAMGSDAPVVFLQGACGDVSQVDNLSPYARLVPETWARLVGGRVGAEAVKVLVSSAAGEAGPIGARSTVLRIPRRKPSAERLERAHEVVLKETNSADWIFAKETVLLEALLAREPVADVEVQAVQVGPAVFVTNPAEFFCQFGLDLKAKSSFPFTFPVELANGCVGYVPTEEAFSEHGGGYETRLTSYSNLEIAAGRKIVAEGLKLAGTMSPGKTPELPKAQPFVEPWPYGNVPPEVR